MEFVAVIKDRSFGDANGKGWSSPSKAKRFSETTSIKEIWEWYKEDIQSGILEIIKLDMEAEE